MQITPRYDGPTIIEMDGDPAAILEPFVRQRRRLERVLDGLDDAQWRTASRCDGWTAQDVITHLVSTNQFWTFSLQAGLDGAPSRFLTGFDPKATPAQLVDAAKGQTPTETLAAFAESNAALLAVAETITDTGWSTMTEAPPGHVSASATVHHALWDSWIHERDVLVPLGCTQEVHDDEVVACLRYAAALTAAFAVTSGKATPGALTIETPLTTVTLTVADDVVHVSSDASGARVVLRGDAVELVEQLTYRAPLTQPVAAEHAWLLSGLAEVFEAA
jgi:uncharacterized protein (TIGR03083 family)